MNESKEDCHQEKDSNLMNKKMNESKEDCHQEKDSNLIAAERKNRSSTEIESLIKSEEEIENMHEAIMNSLQLDSLDFSLDIEEEPSEYIRRCVNRFKERYEVFMIVYLEWKKARVEALEKLTVLQGSVHNDQLKFNKANAVFKNLSVSSRQLKMNYKSTPASILSSITTLATDVVSGLTSVAQARNIDFYMKQFSEIMDRDTEVTKQLYNARSMYFEEYKDVEEVLRKYHSETFSHTMSNIANVLRTEKLWSDIKSKIERDQVPRVLDSVKEFININVNNGAVVKACSTFLDYTKKNTAALDACNSAGKVVCDIYDAFDIKSSMLINITDRSVGQLLLNFETTELSELHAVIEDSDNSQARIESDIQNAIIGLQTEMEEVDKSLKKICIDLSYRQEEN